MKPKKIQNWIGVDLDGTLAHYTTWKADGSIGKPIPKMVERIRRWLKEGEDVRIVTARAASKNPHSNPPAFDLDQLKKVQDWCVEFIGVKLPVQFWKDIYMTELWDDRAVQVIANSGVRADGQP